MDLAIIGRMSEKEAREYLERIRWPNGPVCPHCGVEDNAYVLNGKAHREGLFKCADCRKQFTVTVGTVMHRSKLPLQKWLIALFLMCSSKKGVSALQLQRQLGFGSYKTAWHLAHRIRLAMREDPLASLLSGDVEADETYIGGKKPRAYRPHPYDPGRVAKGIGADFKDRKTPVLVLVERGGRARARVLPLVTSWNLRGAIQEQVDRSMSTLHTDERAGYRKVGKEFAGGHFVVNHSKKEYVAGRASVNTAESYFGLLKRSIVGAYHHVSRAHLGRYLDHQCFLWNWRYESDLTRLEALIQGTGGKRLVYGG